MFVARRFYIVALAVVALLAAGYWWSWLFVIGCVALVALAVALVADFVLLWFTGRVEASRECADRFSNGDDNAVTLHITSTYRMTVDLNVIDEVPVVFQRRDINFEHRLAAGMTCHITYNLRPVRRGVYGFGLIRVFVRSSLGLLERRFSCGTPRDVTVYPSYLMLNRYELLAMSNNLTEMGIKRIRRAGNNTEFEQIKDYVVGDDFRTINWMASARRAQLMVNVYQDERSQQVFSLIDKGRVMQEAFEGMTLLDYAVNAALVISYVAIRKQDKAGLLTFDSRYDAFVQADRSPAHMQTLNEALYALDTSFAESDYSALCVSVNRLVRRRSLLILYTNFSGLNSLRRQLPYLRQLAQRHCLLVVFFSDSQLADYARHKPRDVEAYYRQAMAERVAYEKRHIVATLRQAGIHALYTSPEGLSVNLINKYLEMKSRHIF